MMFNGLNKLAFYARLAFIRAGAYIHNMIFPALLASVSTNALASLAFSSPNGTIDINSNVPNFDFDINALGSTQAIVNDATAVALLNSTLRPTALDAQLTQADEKLEELGQSVSFESVNQNIKAWNFEITRSVDGKIASIRYTDGVEAIVKTFNRVGGVLTTIVLSGDTPAGITLTKTLGRTAGKLATGDYS